MKLHTTLILVLAASTASAQTTQQNTAPLVVSNPAQPVAAQDAAAPPQWVRAPQDSTFPPPPSPAAPATQQSTLSPSAYAGAAPSAASQNSIAPLPPLAPPNNLSQGAAAITPFSPAEIIQLRKQLERTRKAKAFKPVRAIPHIGSISLDLSPGGALPIVRTMPGEVSTLLFLDATGAPWPLAAPPRVSDNRSFDPEWLKSTATVVISALSAYEDGNMVVMLQGFATPIVIKLVSGEPDAKSKTRTVDYRLDLRVPGRGPNAQPATFGPDKIALYDETMQLFLDGLPPREAKRLTPQGDTPGRTQVWQLNGSLYVRTAHNIQTAFDQTIASGDGTRVYRLPPTPFVTLSDLGRSVTIQLDID